MTELNIPKINYDDFYKFMASFSMITFILGILGASLQIIYFADNVLGNWVIFVSVCFYMLLGGYSASRFIWAVRKWEQNQKKLDAKLDAEVTIKLLEVKKEAANYQKQINELSKEESPFPGLDVLKSLQRQYAEKRVESRVQK